MRKSEGLTSPSSCTVPSREAAYEAVYYSSHRRHSVATRPRVFTYGALRELLALERQAVAKIEASSKRWDMLLQMGKDYMDKTSEEKETVSKVQANVAKVLGDEATIVREHEAGKAFFEATNGTTLRNAGLRIKDAILGGKLLLKPATVEGLMAYVKEIIG